jgi:predicted ATPase
VIRRLRLRSFKCFEDQSIDLRRLTLLSGINGSGKSTVIQSLLLLHQALSNSDVAAQSKILPLNGPLVSLGTARDVISKVTGGKRFAIGLRQEELEIDWQFAARVPRDELVATLTGVRWKRGGRRMPSHAGKVLFPRQLTDEKAGAMLLATLKGARFVPADRIGPAETYPLLENDRHASFGPRAEMAVGALYWADSQIVPRLLRHPDPRIGPTVARQVEAWLSDLFPGVILEITRVPNANAVTLGIRTSVKHDSGRPQHVGFGITYALPIIVALVSSRPGDLLLVENPEAHLHPRAQVAIATLCQRAARNGAQIIIETHSDHVLNSVRVGCRRGIIDPTDVTIQFFERDDERVSVTQIQVDEFGRLDNRVTGFFDEMELQLGELLEPL